MKGKFTCWWRAALLGSQQLLSLPVGDYLIAEQWERQGLADISVRIVTAADVSELESAGSGAGRRQGDKRASGRHLGAPEKENPAADRVNKVPRRLIG